MVDMASIAAAVTSLKTASDIAKTFMDVKAGAEVQAKVIELQGAILSAQSNALAAQSDQFSLLQQIRELEGKMAQFKKWETQKERYELKSLGWGTVAYMLKPEARGSEPPHWACPRCFNEQRIEFFQNTGSGRGKERRRGWYCPSCDSEIMPTNDALGPLGVKWLD